MSELKKDTHLQISEIKNFIDYINYFSPNINLNYSQ